MDVFRIIAGFAAFSLAALVAIANWGGYIAAYRRKKNGGSGGYSSVPLISIIFSGVAWLAIKDDIGLWSFVPAAVDIGTICLVAWPFFLLKEALLKR